MAMHYAQSDEHNIHNNAQKHCRNQSIRPARDRTNRAGKDGNIVQTINIDDRK